MKSLPRRMAFVAAAGILSLFMLAPPALAADPVYIPPGQFVIDDANVLGGDVSEVQDAVKQLKRDTGQSLYVIYVDSFTNPSDPNAWVGEVAKSKNMGTSDVVLAVAVQQRNAIFTVNNRSDLFPSGRRSSTRWSPRNCPTRSGPPRRWAR